MKNIKISIIIPIYNAAKFLEECLRSIVKQDFKDIEIICVNDGSTDNSLEILKKLSKEDSRVKIIDKKNEGVSKARNVALEVAQGKYCLNIDSDDYIDQGYFKALYERAEKDNLDITISNIIFDYFNDSSKNYILNDLEILDEKVISGEEYINIFLKNNFYGYTWNKLIKTEAYKRNNLKYNEDIFMMEDVEMILKLAKVGKKIGKVNKAFYHYIQHQTNGSKKISLKRIEDMQKCYEELFKYFKKDKIILFELQKRYLSSIFNFLKCSFNLKNDIKYKILQEEYLLKSKNTPFLKIKKGDIKMEIVYRNILKIFPYLKIMDLLFILDSKVLERLRILRNRRSN